MLRLEQAYGRERFDRFLRVWFDRNAFGTATTADLVAYLHESLLDQEPPENGTAPDIGVWLDGIGLPDDAPDPIAAPLERVDARATEWLEGKAKTAELAFSDWSTHERLHFLRALPSDIAVERLAELDASFHITDTGNSEVLDEWLCIAARRRYAPAFPRVESFLVGVGRRKLPTPPPHALR